MKEWDMGAVLSWYAGFDVALYAGWRPLRCPFHNEKHASASACLTGFKCHVCDIYGDAISVIQRREQVDFSGALALYERITGDRVGRVSKPTTRKSWGVPPFGESDHPKNDGGFQARVREKPDFWT